MINLLTFKESFLWENSELSRSNSIRKLNEAILTSKEYGDSHYKVPDFDKLIVSWGNIMEFIFYYGFDEEARIKRFPWMSQMEHTALISILSSFKNTTTLQSQTIKDLDAEFGQNKNGLIGFELNNKTEKLVTCKSTLDKLHSNYASTFTRLERNQNKSYFIKHYNKGLLKEDPNSINIKIKKGKTHQLFERLDTPKLDTIGDILHGESIQMHFRDKNKSCLNINGQWKHGGFEMPIEVREQLISWGFILPENL